MRVIASGAVTVPITGQATLYAVGSGAIGYCDTLVVAPAVGTTFAAGEIVGVHVDGNPIWQFAVGQVSPIVLASPGGVPVNATIALHAQGLTATKAFIFCLTANEQ